MVLSEVFALCQFALRRSRIVFLVAYLSFLIILLFAPFKPLPRNGAVIENGLLFAEPGIVQTVDPPAELYDELVTNQEFSVIVVAQAVAAPAQGDAKSSANTVRRRILSYSGGCCGLRNFTIAQMGTSLLVAVRTDNVEVERVAGVFETQAVQHIVLTHSKAERRVYVNGDLKRTSPGGRLTGWVPSYHLIFGNEARGENPWFGKLFRVSIFDRVLSPEVVLRDVRCPHGPPTETSLCAARGRLVSYDFQTLAREGFQNFGEGLHRLTRLGLARERVLLSLTPAYDLTSRKRVLEVIGNLIIFIPIGILLLGALGRVRGLRSRFLGTFIVVATALPLLLMVELAQAFLLSRHPSTADLILNMSGIAVGGLIRAYCLPCTKIRSEA